jgi:hypothetical protein
MPAALIEIGPPRGSAGDVLAGGDQLERMASAIAAGIRRYWLGTDAHGRPPAGARRQSGPEEVGP